MVHAICKIRKNTINEKINENQLSVIADKKMFVIWIAFILLASKIIFTSRINAAIAEILNEILIFLEISTYLLKIF